jgi:hypothetical protein
MVVPEIAPAAAGAVMLTDGISFEAVDVAGVTVTV